MESVPGTRTLIARAALKLFVDKGIAETTIRDIAAAASIAEGTMYRHYASKDDLAWDLFHTSFTAFAADLRRCADGEATTAGAITAMIRQACAFYDADPILFSYLLLAQHGQLRKLPADAPNPLLVVADVIATGVARGALPPQDTMVSAAMVFGLVLQVATATFYGRIDGMLSRHAEAMVGAALRVLCAGPPA